VFTFVSDTLPNFFKNIKKSASDEDKRNQKTQEINNVSKEGFIQLPNEVIAYTATYLHWKDALNFRLACTEFEDICASDVMKSTWQEMLNSMVKCMERSTKKAKGNYEDSLTAEDDWSNQGSSAWKGAEYAEKYKKQAQREIFFAKSIMFYAKKVNAKYKLTSGANLEGLSTKIDEISNSLDDTCCIL